MNILPASARLSECAEKLPRWQKEKLGYQDGLPLMTARAMVAVAGRLKCAAVRYAAVDPELCRIWAELYAFAETQQCLHDPVSLYAESSATVSVQGVFAGALIWQACGAGSLRPAANAYR